MKAVINTSIMNKLTILSLFLILAFGCQLEKEIQGNTYLKINGANSVSIFQLFHTGEQSVLDPMEKDQRSIIHQLNLQRPTQLTLIASEKITLLLDPRDSLVIDLENKTPLFSGKGSSRQEAIRLFNQFLTEMNKKEINPISLSREMDSDSFLAEMTRREASITGFADSLKAANPTSDLLFNSWIDQTIVFIKANSLFNYIQMRDDQDVTQILSVIDQMLPLDPSILDFPGYANQWSLITSYLHIIKPLNDQGYFDNMDNLVMEQMLSYERDTTLRQLMLASVLTDDLESMDTTLFGAYQNQIKQILTIPALKEAVTAKYDHAVAQMNKGNDLTTDAYEGDYNVDKTIRTILKENKGKVIYVDIWATWGKPCLEEFKISKEFKAQFNTEDVVYVYACAQSPKKESWKALVNKYDLRGTHLFLTDEQFLQFGKHFPVGYFPSYYIIDQNGKIVNKEANLSPSNPETTQIIKLILE